MTVDSWGGDQTLNHENEPKPPAYRSLIRYRPLREASDPPPPTGVDGMHWARLLDCRRRSEWGNPLALIDALTLCQKINLSPPEWLSAAIAERLMGGILKTDSGEGPGRGKTDWDRTKTWLARLRRAHTFNNIRIWQRDRPTEALEVALGRWGMTDIDIQRRPALRAILNLPREPTVNYAEGLAFAMLANTWASGTASLIRNDHIQFLPPQDGKDRKPRLPVDQVAFWRLEWDALLPETKALFGLNAYTKELGREI